MDQVGDAFVVLRPDHAVEAAAPLSLARAHLAPYKPPRKIVLFDNPLRNTAPKLLKRELRRYS